MTFGNTNLWTYTGNRNSVDSPIWAYSGNYFVLPSGPSVTTVTLTYTVDSLLKKICTLNYTSDSLLQTTITLSYTVDSYLYSRHTLNYSLDSVLIVTTNLNYSIDALLSKQNVLNYSLDGILKQTKTINYTIDSLNIPLHFTETFLDGTDTKSKHIPFILEKAFYLDDYTLSVSSDRDSDSYPSKKSLKVYLDRASDAGSNFTNVYMRTPVYDVKKQNSTVEYSCKVYLGGYSDFVWFFISDNSYSDNIISDCSFGIHIRNTTSDLIRTYVREGGTTTTSNTYVTLNDTWYKLKIVYNVAEDKVSFYVYDSSDTQIFSSADNSVDSSLNLGSVWFRVGTYHTTKSIYIDDLKLPLCKSKGTWVTVDAFLSKQTTTTATCDAILIKQPILEYTSDALLVGSATLSYSVDCLLKRESVLNYTIDSLLQKIFTLDCACDGILRQSKTVNYTFDSFLFKVKDMSIIIDALLIKKNYTYFSIDAILKETHIFSFTVDAMLKTTSLLQYTVDAELVVINTYVLNYTVDAVLYTTSTLNYTVDAVLCNQIILNYVIDSLLLKTKYIFIYNFARFFLKQTSDYTVDACLFSTHITTVTIDSILIKTFTLSYTCDAELVSFITYTLEYKVDGLIIATNITNYTVDGLLYESHTLNYTVDGIVIYIQTVQLKVDGLLLYVGSLTYTVDALLYKVSSLSYTVDSILYHIFALNYSVDAILIKQQILQYVVDGLLLITQTLSYTVDAITHQYKYVYATVDGIIETANVVNVIADGMLQTSAIVQYTTSAYLCKTKETTFTTDGLLQKTNILNFTADCLIRYIYTINIISDGMLYVTRSLNYKADAIVQAANTVLCFVDAIIGNITYSKCLEVDISLDPDDTLTVALDPDDQLETELDPDDELEVDFACVESSVSAWQYYKQLNISDTGGVGADYQMKIRIYKGTGTDDPTTGTIYCNNLCSNFPNDIRFGKTSHLSTDTQLKQWIENETDEYVDIWVKLPKPAQDKIYLFIGNAEAEKYSDGNSVFLFFDDFNYFAPYDTTKWDKSGSGIITKTFETQFTAAHGGQGLTNDETYFYWGRNNGSGVNGTIYKIRISDGVEVDSFDGPPHAAGGDYREDHRTLLFTSYSPDSNGALEVWEIDPTTGTKIREWDFTGEGYNRGSFAVYKSPDHIYLFTFDTSFNFKIKEYQINDDGTWSGVGIEYSHSSLGTAQGADYVNGHIYYLYDNGISKLQLNSDGSITIAEQITNLEGCEKEGLTYYNGHFYYGDGCLRIRKILDQVSIDVSTGHISIYSKNADYGVWTALRCKWRASSSLNYPGFGYGDKNSTTVNVIDDAYTGHGIIIGKIHVGNAYLQGRQTNNGVNRAETGSLLPSSDQDTFHIYEIRRKASSSEFTVDDNVVASLSNYYPTEDLYIGIGGHTAHQNVKSIVDWIAVRKFASPEPSWDSFSDWQNT